MKKLIIGIFVGFLSISVFTGSVFAVVNAVTPSTNDINRTNGWAHVDQTNQAVGATDLQFISTRNFFSCFEYRTDGDTGQKISDTNYNTNVTDGLYPYFCQKNNNRTVTIPAERYVEVRMVFGAESDERFDWTRFDVLYQLKGKEVKKATGGIWMGSPLQQMQFNAFDQGSARFDKGSVEYWNYEYPGVLHYTANVTCASIHRETGTARYMFQIPEGFPGLTGLYVVSSVTDGGTPGTNGDTYGHSATPDVTTALSWCESGNGFSPAMYPVTDGNLVVHK